MDILIKGMEMKDYPQSITINPDGSIVKDTFGLHRLVEEWKAVALPEHGDLIDRKELLKLDNITYVDTGYWSTDYEAVKVTVIKKAPVIVEASDG